MNSWNPDLYLKFNSERTMPAIDLANRITGIIPNEILDLGCGPGNSTYVLTHKFTKAHVTGIDSSRAMIEKAKSTISNADFKVLDASKDLPKLNTKYDIVFSNACIQWIENHPVLLKNMMNLLNPNGILAIQIPVNYDEPIHKIIRKVASLDKWQSILNFSRTFYTLTESEYYDILCNISSDFTMWKTTYFHKMNSHEDILKWYSSTGLRPYLELLPENKVDEFKKDILTEVIKDYPKQQNGTIIFRFPRLFFIARH